jgi:formate C-acetyltransferase
MTALARVLSFQELRLADPAAKATSRTLRMYNEIRASQPRVSVQRAWLLTESFQQTEGQPIVRRWGRALRHIAENIQIFIGPDDLIVGRAAEFGGRHAVMYPELDGAHLVAGIEALRSRKESPATLLDEDAERIREMASYWKGKTFVEAYPAALPEATRSVIFGPDRSNYLRQFFSILATATWRSSQNWVHDYDKVLRRGIGALRADAAARLAALDSPADIAAKGAFLEAAIDTCDAIVTLSRRYAALAREMAARESDERRKTELLEIAEVTERVPEHPARTFREAVQAHWFTQMFSRLEQKVGGQISNGRMDQMLQPFYRDIETGVLTREAAIELLQCEWLHMFESLDLPFSPDHAASMDGYPHFEPVTLGGKTRDGRDATNDVSYLILDSQRGWPCTYPEIAVRIHSRTPDRFLHATCEAIKEGKGIPKLLNDEDIIPFYLAHGVSIEEANDYAASGCIESRLPNRENHVTGNCMVNYGAAIEQTLRGGKLKLFGQHQFGVPTPDPLGFQSYDDLWDAFRTQIRHMVRHAMIQQNVANALKQRYFAAPLASMLHDLAFEQCKDLHTHDLAGALHLPCIETVGFSTAINSLMALKTLVFERKAVSMRQMLDALENNFENNEPLRQLCLNAPKYGNADPDVDRIGWEIENIIVEMIHQYPTASGDHFMLRCIPVTAHVPAGRVVGATPDGRKAGVYLSEGISAFHGTDVKGVTAALVSCANARNDRFSARAARLINQKFMPRAVAGPEGTKRLMSYVRSWCDLKLWHIQFNIINRDTLIAARETPEAYSDLVVRVAGYSAYFTELSPALQTEIIERTEHGL